MARLVVIGAGARISGWSLAGADVLPAESAAEVEDAWSHLDPDVAVVIVSPEAADVVDSIRRGAGPVPDRLVAVMPT
jgi:vacuolar-type H+-ATPase subunit F/Vma7